MNRPTAVYARPGGKGTNVARALHSFGLPIRLARLRGRHHRRRAWTAALRELGVPAAFTPAAGETRRTFTVVDGGGPRRAVQRAGTRGQRGRVRPLPARLRQGRGRRVRRGAVRQPAAGAAARRLCRADRGGGGRRACPRCSTRPVTRCARASPPAPPSSSPTSTSSRACPGGPLRAADGGTDLAAVAAAAAGLRAAGAAGGGGRRSAPTGCWP